MKRSMLAGLIAALALGLVGAPASADGETSYAPPYDEGPSGGDAVSHSQRSDDGRIAIVRATPHPGGISCPGDGAFAKWQVDHELTGPVETITVQYSEAAIDPFVFVLLSARRADGEWLGSEQVRGPLVGDGEVALTLDPALFDDGTLAPGEVLTIQFGLEMASACPHVNAGTARFTELTVS